MMRIYCSLVILLTQSLTLLGSSADWPTYNADPQRSGITDERLDFPLTRSWIHYPTQAPQPAWPEPGRTLNLQDFDRAFQPVAAGGRVFYGSSSDDSVRALDARTGEKIWRFTVDAPIRFAPHIDEGRCYFAADDGRVYCLDAADGTLIWQFDAAPEHRMLPGNERMISRWPCRSGVLVVDGVVYVSAGIWPSEGVYFYALSAHSGEVIWCNDTTYSTYIKYPHVPSASFGGPSPEGYLLSTRDLLLAPTGKALPAVFDRATGELRYYSVENGATWVTIAGDYFFTPLIKKLGSLDVRRLGEHGAHDGDGMGARRLEDGTRSWPLSDSHYELVVADHEGQLPRRVRHGLSERQRLLVDRSMFYAAGEGVIEALDCSDTETVRRVWKAQFPRTYAMILAGDTLIAGGPGRITAWAAQTGEETWTVEMDGRVRGLAVADGRLLAATDKGTITSFAASAVSTKVRHVGPGAPGRERTIATALEPEHYASILALLREPGAYRGYALLIGEPDARLAEALTAATHYRTVCLLPDDAALQRERNRLLDEGNLYGSRIAAHRLPASGRLPYAQYHANLVVVSGNAHGISPQEIYRVTRPSGGMIVGLNEGRVIVESLRGKQDVQVAAMTDAGAASLLTRGRLPGAYDWNSQNDRDQRLKWPLELLWFGGPGPARMVSRHWKAPTPVYANGRYFALGPYHIMAVDAYNGYELWSRQIGGKMVYNDTKYTADDDFVYVHYDGYCVVFDAQTGAVRSVYGDRAESPWIRLDEPQIFEFRKDQHTRGTVTMESRPEGLVMTLRTIPPPAPAEGESAPAPFPESWALHFDFRPPQARYGDDTTGLFRLSFSGVTGEQEDILSLPSPPYTIAKNPVDAGSELVLLFDRDDLGAFLGGDPAGFQFAATLYTGGDRRFERIDLFANGMNSLLNAGWGVCVLDEERADTLTLAASPVPVKPIDELPEYARTYPRQPHQYTAYWTIDNMDQFELDFWPPVERDEIPPVRTMPLTGITSPRDYSKSYGCGGIISSATMDFMRSGTLGIYDRVDDSGMRNFGAYRPGCGMTMLPVGGILVSSEGASDCHCAYNFQTSLALAPARTRSNEDWAMFNGRMRSALIRHAALNIGAPGDRRDEDGTLWLGFPRQPVALEEGLYTFDIPASLEYYQGFGPFRFNANRVKIGGTDRPWLFASGIRGLKRASFDLYYATPETCLALKGVEPPVIDGQLDDACWQGIPSLQDEAGRTSVYLRYDSDNLYVGASRSGVIDRRGTVTPLELVLRNEGGSRFYHIVTDQLGTATTSVLDYGFDIPRLEDITVDGCTEEWGETGFQIPLGDGGITRFAWNDTGLLVACDVPHESYIEREEMTGVLVLVVRPGSTDYYQFTLDTRTGQVHADHRIRTDDQVPEIPVVRNVSGLMHWGRPFGNILSEVPELTAASTVGNGMIRAEALLPWDSLKITPEQGDEVSFTVLAFDPSQMEPTSKGRPDNQDRILEGRHSMNRMRLADTAETLPDETFYRHRRLGYDMYQLEIPMQYGQVEQGEISCAVVHEEHFMCAELAVPWTNLAQHGIIATDLNIMVDPSEIPRGVFQQADRIFSGRAHSVYTQSMTRPDRNYTVRLYFMEPDEVETGERMFDIVLQGETVAEKVDIAKESGGPRMALIREFRGIAAEQELVLEFATQGKAPSEHAVPVLSAIEILEEEARSVTRALPVEGHK